MLLESDTCKFDQTFGLAWSGTELPISRTRDPRSTDSDTALGINASVRHNSMRHNQVLKFQIALWHKSGLFSCFVFIWFLNCLESYIINPLYTDNNQYSRYAFYVYLFTLCLFLLFSPSRNSKLQQVCTLFYKARCTFHIILAYYRYDPFLDSSTLF